MTSSKDSVASLAGNLAMSASPLTCTISFQGLTVFQMRQLYRCVVGITSVCGTTVLDPPDWLDRSLALALALSLKDLENASALTNSSSRRSTDLSLESVGFSPEECKEIRAWETKRK